MSLAYNNLKLVLSEDGSEPLVLECCWEKEGKRRPSHQELSGSDSESNLQEPILILNQHVRTRVGRRAVCILLLLSKLPRRGPGEPEETIVFKAECDFSSWISTLGEWDKKGELKTWVEDKFRTAMNRPIISAHPGTKRADRGIKCANAQFHSKVLPIKKLRIFTRSSEEGVVDKELFGIRLLTTALKLEEKHWNVAGDKSCIKNLVNSGSLRLPHKLFLEAKRLGITSSQSTVSTFDISPDELFEKAKSHLSGKKGPTHHEEESIVYNRQLKVDFDEHFNFSRSFFSAAESPKKFFPDSDTTIITRHLSEHLNGSTRTVMNRRQAELFRGCCLYYVSLLIQRNDWIERFVFPAREDEEVERWRELRKAIDSIFSTFATRHGLAVVSMNKRSSLYTPDSILDEIKSLLIKATDPSCRPYAAGTLTALKILFSNFLRIVCVPQFDPSCCLTKAEKRFLKNVERVAREATHFIQWSNFFGDANGDNEIEFIVGFRSLLKADALFWFELGEEMDKL